MFVEVRLELSLRELGRVVRMTARILRPVLRSTIACQCLKASAASLRCQSGSDDVTR